MMMKLQLALLVLVTFSTVNCNPSWKNPYLRWKSVPRYRLPSSNAIQVSNEEPNYYQMSNEGATQQKLDNLYESLISEVSGRIVGGRNARRTEVPYQIRLMIDLPQSRMSRVCGAALTELYGIQFALTAAHCVLGEVKNRITAIAPSQVSIIAGDHDTSRLDWEQYRKASSIVMHSQYEGPNKRSPQNDIAILFYSPKFDITSYVSTLKLPGTQWALPSKALISGWGTTTSIYSSAARPSILKVVEIKTISNQACKSHQFDQKLISWKQMCVLENGKGPCKGDSGGPAAGKNSSSGQWYLAGIANYVQADCGDAIPSVYALVTAYVTWIQQEVVKYSNMFTRRRRG